MGVDKQRCAACEAPIDVLDMCLECTPKAGPGFIRVDTCKRGHQLVQTNSGRRRCHICASRLVIESRKRRGAR
jgi:hypothetical protein